MRSFPTRLANSVTRTVFLVPCLLVCLACVTPTPFPIENLEKGMTPEAVRVEFGEPELIETVPGGEKWSLWTYENEQQNWFNTAIFSTVLLPHCIILTAATMPFGAEHWCAGIVSYVEEGSVILLFEKEKLAGWTVRDPPVVPYHDLDLAGIMQQQRDQQWFRDQQWRDYEHHKKGHDHHHH